MKRNLKFLTLLIFAWALMAQAQSSEKNKKVVYKSHTQLDFTGDSIEGKIKAPAVFYIFQRKRSLGHEAARSPSSLSFHEAPMKQILKDTIKE